MPAPIAYDAPLHPADRRAPSAAARSVMCHRCKVQRSTIKLQTALFCQQCFRHHFETKMRMAMEQVKVCAYIARTEQEDEGPARQALVGSVPQAQASTSATVDNGHGHDEGFQSRGRVALGLSGGMNSVALLHVAKQRLLPPAGYERQVGKAFEIFGIDVIYVDDGVLFQDGTDRAGMVRQIVEEAGGAEGGLNLIIVKMEDVFEDGLGAECSMQPSGSRQLQRNAITVKDSSEALSSLFAALRPEGTARTMLANARSRTEDMHQLLISHILRREAKRRGARCLLTGENATRRAIRVVDGISRGRGYKLPLENGPAQWQGLFMLQPMSDATAKEIAYFVRTAGLQSIEPRDLVSTELLRTETSGKGEKASMGRLTESLIHLLESNVPGTINTVNRTNGKLIYSEQMASHGYEEDLEFDANCSQAPSVNFEQVGPVLPLRFRRREAASPSPTTNSSFDSRGLPDVRGMGLGGLGAKFYSAAKSFPRYHNHLACPLCQMPAQRGLDAWKRGLTVDKSRMDNASVDDPMASTTDDAVLERATLELSTLLCYACSLLLVTPEASSSIERVLLPSHVLEGAVRRMNHKDSEVDLHGLDGAQNSATNGAADTTALATQATSSTRQQEAMELRKVDAEELRKRVDSFLLDDAEEEKQGATRPSAQPNKSFSRSAPSSQAQSTTVSTNW